MKRFKIGFLAVVALAAMSFTLLSNSRPIKKTTLTNCYTPSAAVEIVSATSPCTNANIICNDATQIGKYLKSSSVGTLPSSVDCDLVNNVICCIKYEDGGIIDPSGCAEFKLPVGGSLTAFNGSTIAPNHYVKVKEVNCKTN
jgi:hypothetical protein